ncbi:hypothetical protein RIF29_13944 [Crotalaria pallida]|uniref:Disease resistance protein RPM1 n=1 Tax=Crotalaria pallida TaxID=3830 RepID=A0AAN9IB48_CROPI
MEGTLLSFARDKLLPLLIEVRDTLRGVPKKVEEIKQELEHIQVDINVADRMAMAEQDKDTREGIKAKVKQLREAAFRIEDVVEEYNMTSEELQQPVDPGCAAALSCDIAAYYIRPMMIRLRISREIQDIKKSVDRINGRSEGAAASTSSTSARSQELTRRHDLEDAVRYIKEDEVVGFEGPRNELMGWLEEGRAERTVIAVVGMGGRGKTTLAKTVYEKVIQNFDCYAFITVSEPHTVEDLLGDVLKKFKEGKGEAPAKDIAAKDTAAKDRLNKLIDEVRDYLQLKRYVVLFDDVWKKNFWSEIQFALYDNKKRSRVLITTRSMEVAQNCKDSCFVHIHDLQPLSERKSWELFSQKAFRNDPNECCPKGFEDISWKFVKKCEGLPLALLAIAGLLACKVRNLGEWQKLNGQLLSELEKKPTSTGITHILCLSYDDLPYHLQQCFLHFGIYPKDCEIESATVIRQWIAEGFVKYESNKTLEEVAEQYLQELIHRSLVQVSSLSSDGKAKSCRVHDLLREIILDKFKDSSFCYFVREDDQTNLSGMIRRLIIATNSNDVVVPIGSSHIWSVYIFRGVELPEDFLRKLLTAYKILKVLDFEHAPLNYIPESWGNFFRLRYLSFRKTNIVSLPQSIGNLWLLETLDLRQTRVRQMPREINKLKKLRHLLANHTIWFFNNGIQLMKEDIRGLEFLQTLRQVETDYGGVELISEIEKLKQLRLLGLIHVKQEHGRALCSLIVHLQQLEKLYIDAISFAEVIDLHHISSPPELPLQKLRIRGKLERFPEWIPNLQNLVNLSLVSSNLTNDPLILLQHMPNLFFLSLDSAYEGESLDFQDGKFQQLKKLSLRHLPNLNYIHIGEGALQLLEVFALEYIPQLFEKLLGQKTALLVTQLEVLEITKSDLEIGTCPQCSEIQILNNFSKQWRWIFLLS